MGQPFGLFTCIDVKNLVKLSETDEAKGSKAAPKKCLIQPMSCTTQIQLCTIFTHLFFKKGRSISHSVYFKVVGSYVSEKT